MTGFSTLILAFGFLVVASGQSPMKPVTDLENRNSTECSPYRLQLQDTFDIFITHDNLTVGTFRFNSMKQEGCKVEIISTYSGAVKLAVLQKDPDFKDSVLIPMTRNGEYKYLMKGDAVGISHLIFRVRSAQDKVLEGHLSRQAKVVRTPSPLLTGFGYFVGVMAIFNMLVLGCRSNLVKMRDFIPKNKRAVVLGVFCPMFYLPLTAICFILGFTYGLDFSVNAFLPIESLMFITIAALPGGGWGIPWTKLIGGCTTLDYSSMTIITLLSLGSTPLLCFLLGLIWYLDNIPMLQLYVTHVAVWEVILITAFTLGLILRYFNLKGVWRMVKFFLFPVSVCFVVAVLAFGLYTNVYIFFIRRGWLALSALLFSWVAYFFGLVTAFAFRLPPNQIKTVAMNSGVCQPVLAMAIFCWTLPSPEADLGHFMAFIVLLGSYLPLIVAAIISVSIRCCFASRKEDTEKCLPEQNLEANGKTSNDNWGMATEEGTSESEVNLEMHSDATTVIVEDKDE